MENTTEKVGAIRGSKSESQGKSEWATDTQDSKYLPNVEEQMILKPVLAIVLCLMCIHSNKMYFAFSLNHYSTLAFAWWILISEYIFYSCVNVKIDWTLFKPWCREQETDRAKEQMNEQKRNSFCVFSYFANNSRLPVSLSIKTVQIRCILLFNSNLFFFLLLTLCFCKIIGSGKKIYEEICAV